MSTSQLNIYGEKLKLCSNSPLTGYSRNGYCEFDKNDNGLHNVCVFLTGDFLKFTKTRGNDLYPLKEGNRWCICIGRWIEAYNESLKTRNDKIVPRIFGEYTNINVLNYINKDILRKYLI